MNSPSERKDIQDFLEENPSVLALLKDPEKREAELLKQINLGITEEEWQRYFALIEKREEERISEEELQELIALTDKLEEANARRMEYLVELAILRHTTLDNVMKDLGIQPVSNGGK